MHPVMQHSYLIHSPALMSSIALVPVAAWLATAAKLADSTRLLVAALMLFEAVPGIPRSFRPIESLRALPPFGKA